MRFHKFSVGHDILLAMLKFVIFVSFVVIRAEQVASAVDPFPLLGIPDPAEPHMDGIVPGPERERVPRPELEEAAHEFLIRIANRRRELDDQHSILLRYSVGLIALVAILYGYLVYKGIF